MSSIFKEEQFTKICGNLIRDERKARRKSAAVIAELAGLSQQYLSEIERGTRRLSSSVMMDLCAVLHMSFHFDHSVIEEADKALRECLRALADYDYVNLSTLLDLLLSDDYRYSYAYSYYQCASLLKNIFVDKKRLCTPISPKQIESNEFLNACICFLNSKITQTINDVDAGLNVCMEGDSQFDMIRCLLLSEKASILEANQDFRSALKSYEESKAIAQSFYLITGALSIEMSIASIYSRLGQYQESSWIYARISDVAARNDITQISNAAEFNSAYNSMISGDYQSCIDQITHLMGKFAAIPKEYNSVYYLLVYSYFMLGDETETAKYCQEALAQISPTDFPYKIIYLIIISLDNQKISEKIRGIDQDFDEDMILAYFDETIQNGDPGDILIVYKLLNKYFKSKGSMELALLCSEKLIEYLTAEIIANPL